MQKRSSVIYLHQNYINTNVNCVNTERLVVDKF